MWPTLLRASCPDTNLDSGSVALALHELEQRGHLLRLPDSRIEGEVEYVFKDPAERERLAAQVAPRIRRELHRAMADFLTPLEEAQVDSSDLAVLLAWHLTQAGSSFRGALAYLKAAEISRRHAGALQASAYFELGQRALGEHDNRRRLDVLHDYGALLVELGRPGQARSAFIEMATLAERMGLPAKRGAGLNRLARIQREAGELLEAEQTLREALATFSIAADARGVASTKDDLGKVLWLLGERGRAIPLLREALEDRKCLGNERSLAVSLSNLAVVWEEQGRSATSERALGIVEDIAAPPRAIENFSQEGQKDRRREMGARAAAAGLLLRCAPNDAASHQTFWSCALPVKSLAGPRHPRSRRRQPEACRTVRPSDSPIASASNLRLGSPQIEEPRPFAARAHVRKALRDGVAQRIEDGQIGS